MVRKFTRLDVRFPFEHVALIDAALHMCNLHMNLLESISLYCVHEICDNKLLIVKKEYKNCKIHLNNRRYYSQDLLN